jgi:RimJ/RimL family protein N-acetyltransferase
MISIVLIPLGSQVLAELSQAPTSSVGGYSMSKDIQPIVQEIAAHNATFFGDAADNEWGCFLAADANSEQVIGTCAYKGAPNENGEVEIAYFTFPPYEGRGYATAMACELIQKALHAPEAPTVIAHTLPEKNASGRVLTKAGMQYIGEHHDPEDGLVWHWQLRD